MRISSRLSWLPLVLAAALITLSNRAGYAGDIDWFDDYRWRGDSITIEHGNSVAHNIAVQTINPWPWYVRNSKIDVDGQRLLHGITRYKANRSIQPRLPSTQTINITPSNGGLSINGN
jgi:hypothetical protein